LKKPAPSNKTMLPVHVRPSAGRNEVTGFTVDALQVKIAAPPVQGKANRELLVFLSQQLGVRQDALTIIRGLSSRYKLVRVDGLNIVEIRQRLFPTPSSSSDGDATR